MKKKDKQLTKKISSGILLIILIGLTTSLMISPQIKYIYQYDKSIGIGHNQIFATPANPTGIATDNAGNVYVIDHGDGKVKKFTTNGTFVKEWNIN